jgi:hypothetical protein
MMGLPYIGFLWEGLADPYLAYIRVPFFLQKEETNEF